MSAPGYQISRDPTAVVGTRTAAYVIELLLFLVLASALGPTPLSPLAEYTTVPEGMDMTEACDRLRDVEDDVSGCVLIGDDVYFTDATDGLIQLLVMLLVFVLVYVVWQGISGLTPGKLLLGLRTVGEDGRPPGPLKAFVRSVLWIVDGLPCIPLVGFITALTSTGHRRVGDMAAKTFVVSKRDLGRPVMVPGLTSTTTYGAPTPYGAPPGYGTPAAPGTAPWGTPPGAPGAPGAPGTPAWGTPASAPPPSGSPYPTADGRPAPPTSPYGTPAAPPTPAAPSPGAAPSGGHPTPEPTAPTAPAPAAGTSEPAAPAPGAGGLDASAFGESTDPAEADRPAGDTAPAAGDVTAPASDAAAETETVAEAEPSDATASAASTAATTEQTYSPQWDAARGAYIQWDPNRSRWLQWDDTAKEWKVL